MGGSLRPPSATGSCTPISAKASGPQRMDFATGSAWPTRSCSRVLRAMEINWRRRSPPELAPARRHVAPAARAAVPPPYRPRRPPAILAGSARARAAALARDYSCRARRGARDGLRLVEPVRPRLQASLRRAAEPHAAQRLSRTQRRGTALQQFVRFAKLCLPNRQVEA